MVITHDQILDEEYFVGVIGVVGSNGDITRSLVFLKSSVRMPSTRLNLRDGYDFKRTQEPPVLLAATSPAFSHPERYADQLSSSRFEGSGVGSREVDG